MKFGLLILLFISHSVSATKNISKTPLINGFEFIIECITEDIRFCNKVEKEMIITGKNISNELFIFQKIKIKVIVYPMGVDKGLFDFLIDSIG